MSRILIIEDEVSIAELERDYLELSGFEVDTVNDGEQGLKKATLEFEVPRDFVAGDCRRCPISFIGQSGTDRVYECPLNMRGTCKLVIK